jgi:hypothetical protein
VLAAVKKWKNKKDPSGFTSGLTFGEDQPNGLHSLIVVQLKGDQFVEVGRIDGVQDR